MRDWAIVTGGGTGIGRALALRLAERGLDVVIVGRREEPLENVRQHSPELIHAVTADVAVPEGRQRIAAAVPEDARLRALVHNAGVLEPVGPLAEVDLESWRKSQAVNVEGPLFLTQALLPRLQGGGRVLHVSSGAAHHGYRGWGAYCTSKAALHMLYQVYRDELSERDIAVGSVRPGVVDTPMQELIRTKDKASFPAVDRFIQLKRGGQLVEPNEVADFINWLLLETGAAEFSEHEWDFTSDQHRARRKA